jgi:hypothetical protein
MMSGWVTYEREKLYQEVWAEPIRDVAKRYEVSDVALAKTCRKLAIPLPGRGYWAKVRAGQKPKRTTLPALPKGVRPVISTYRTYNPSTRREMSPESATVVRREKSRESRVAVPEELSEPHPLVATAASLLEGRKPQGGLVSSPRRRCLDIHVAPASLDRGLRILDSLIRALEARGLSVEVTPIRRPPKDGQDSEAQEGNVTQVLVDDEWIAFGLSEEYDVIRHPEPEPPKDLEDWKRYWWIRDHRKDPDYVPSGRLGLHIRTENLGVRRTWRDAQIQRVEKCLNDFIAYLYLTAEAIKEDRAAKERRRLEGIEDAKRRAEAEERRQEEERLARVEERREKVLEKQMERWQHAQEVQAFLARALRVFEAGTFSRDESVMIQRWLEWVKDYSKELDRFSSMLEEAVEWEAAVEEPRWRWQPWRA